MKCETKFCRGLVTPSGKSPKCAKCRSRAFKAAHPLKYAFNKLRSRAAERGHEFLLSYSQFADFAVQSGWDAGRGKEAHSLSIDRIDETRGYVADNLQVLTLSENTAKANRRRYAPLQGWMKVLEEKALTEGSRFE